MKIGFPAAGLHNEKKSLLAGSFVESGLMGVYNTQTDEIVVVPKENFKNGIVDWVHEEEISLIITPDIKPMALKVFKEEGVEVYKAIGKILSLNIQLLFNKDLMSFSVESKMQEKSSCSSSCSSCSSTTCN